jgi:hypothetical protein
MPDLDRLLRLQDKLDADDYLTELEMIALLAYYIGEDEDVLFDRYLDVCMQSADGKPAPF